MSSVADDKAFETAQMVVEHSPVTDKYAHVNVEPALSVRSPILDRLTELETCVRSIEMSDVHREVDSDKYYEDLMLKFGEITSKEQLTTRVSFISRETECATQGDLSQLIIDSEILDNVLELIVRNAKLLKRDISTCMQLKEHEGGYDDLIEINTRLETFSSNKEVENEQSTESKLQALLDHGNNFLHINRQFTVFFNRNMERLIQLMRMHYAANKQEIRDCEDLFPVDHALHIPSESYETCFTGENVSFQESYVIKCFEGDSSCDEDRKRTPEQCLQILRQFGSISAVYTEFEEHYRSYVDQAVDTLSNEVSAFIDETTRFLPSLTEFMSECSRHESYKPDPTIILESVALTNLLYISRQMLTSLRFEWNSTIHALRTLQIIQAEYKQMISNNRVVHVRLNVEILSILFSLSQSVESNFESRLGLALSHSKDIPDTRADLHGNSEQRKSKDGPIIEIETCAIEPVKAFVQTFDKLVICPTYDDHSVMEHNKYLMKFAGSELVDMLEILKESSDQCFPCAKEYIYYTKLAMNGSLQRMHDEISNTMTETTTDVEMPEMVAEGTLKQHIPMAQEMEDMIEAVKIRMNEIQTEVDNIPDYTRETENQCKSQLQALRKSWIEMRNKYKELMQLHKSTNAHFLSTENQITHRLTTLQEMLAFLEFQFGEANSTTDKEKESEVDSTPATLREKIKYAIKCFEDYEIDSSTNAPNSLCRTFDIAVDLFLQVNRSCHLDLGSLQSRLQDLKSSCEKYRNEQNTLKAAIETLENRFAAVEAGVSVLAKAEQPKDLPQTFQERKTLKKLSSAYEMLEKLYSGREEFMDFYWILRFADSFEAFLREHDSSTPLTTVSTKEQGQAALSAILLPWRYNRTLEDGEAMMNLCKEHLGRTRKDIIFVAKECDQRLDEQATQLENDTHQLCSNVAECAILQRGNNEKIGKAIEMEAMYKRLEDDNNCMTRHVNSWNEKLKSDSKESEQTQSTNDQEAKILNLTRFKESLQIKTKEYRAASLKTEVNALTTQLLESNKDAEKFGQIRDVAIGALRRSVQNVSTLVAELREPSSIESNPDAILPQAMKEMALFSRVVDHVVAKLLAKYQEFDTNKLLATTAYLPSDAELTPQIIGDWIALANSDIQSLMSFFDVYLGIKRDDINQMETALEAKNADLAAVRTELISDVDQLEKSLKYSKYGMPGHFLEVMLDFDQLQRYFTTGSSEIVHFSLFMETLNNRLQKCIVNCQTETRLLLDFFRTNIQENITSKLSVKREQYLQLQKESKESNEKLSDQERENKRKIEQLLQQRKDISRIKQPLQFHIQPELHSKPEDLE